MEVHRDAGRGESSAGRRAPTTQVRRVTIMTGSPLLGDGLRRLVASLDHVAPAAPDGSMAAGDVVIAPVGDCLPARCAEFTAAGARVIILASIPRERERESYARAGAFAYVTMAVDTTELRAAIEGALAAAQQPPRCEPSAG